MLQVSNLDFMLQGPVLPASHLLKRKIMEITKEQTQAIADLYLTPLLSLVDGVLANPVFLKTAEASLEKLRDNLGTSQALSGILLDMNDVDKRAVETETYKVAIKLLQIRQKQRTKTIELHQGKVNRQQIRQALGF